MKILPSDDLNHNPDYNKHYKRYFPELHPDYTVKHSIPERFKNALAKVVVWFKSPIDDKWK